MLITLDVLQQRRDSLSNTKVASESELEMLQERVKAIKKEVANIKGAILEIDRFIEAHD
jgi:cell division protein FtsB